MSTISCQSTQYPPRAATHPSTTPRRTLPSARPGPRPRGRPQPLHLHPTAPRDRSPKAVALPPPRVLLNPWAASTLGAAVVSELAQVARDYCAGQASTGYASHWPALACLGMGVCGMVPALVAPHREAWTEQWRKFGQRVAKQQRGNAPAWLQRAVVSSIALVAEGSEHACVWATRIALLGVTPWGKQTMAGLLVLSMAAGYLHCGWAKAHVEAGPGVREVARLVKQGTRQVARWADTEPVRHASHTMEMGLNLVAVAVGFAGLLAVRTHLPAVVRTQVPGVVDNLEEIFELMRLAIWLPLAVRQFSVAWTVFQRGRIPAK